MLFSLLTLLVTTFVFDFDKMFDEIYNQAIVLFDDPEITEAFEQNKEMENTILLDLFDLFDVVLLLLRNFWDIE